MNTLQIFSKHYSERVYENWTDIVEMKAMVEKVQKSITDVHFLFNEQVKHRCRTMKSQSSPPQSSLQFGRASMYPFESDSHETHHEHDDGPLSASEANGGVADEEGTDSEMLQDADDGLTGSQAKCASGEIDVELLDADAACSSNCANQEGVVWDNGVETWRQEHIEMERNFQVRPNTCRVYRKLQDLNIKKTRLEQAARDAAAARGPSPCGEKLRMPAHSTRQAPFPDTSEGETGEEASEPVSPRIAVGSRGDATN
eukprot:TRINITY_DN10882_c1_g1_i1.p1 TRINITY_DN10882_c1_g1~~TRINITY_DN10882_c1_g1_i1.p1  ORF type:complete len:257 (+),score=58.24 TRINITY_DN10882_c1_g1_i1:92-862(+)